MEQRFFCILVPLFLCLIVYIECQQPPVYPSAYNIDFIRRYKCRHDKQIPLTEDITEYYDYDNQKERFDVRTVIQGLPNITIIILQRWDKGVQYTFSLEQSYCYSKSLIGWQMQPPNFLSNFTYSGKQVVEGILCNQWDDLDDCSMFTRVDNDDPKRMITVEGYVLDYGPLIPGPQNPSIFTIPSICENDLRNKKDTIFFPDKTHLITTQTNC